MAGRCLQNERPGHTLQSVDLVHEVYLRLVDVNQVDWQHRAHFFAVSVTLKQRMLLRGARSRRARKRGAKHQPLYLEAALDVSCGRARELIALDDALNTL